MFTIGKLYTRRTDIHDKYGGNRQSGNAACAAHPYVFLFSSPSGKDHGYDDRWLSSDEYLYTGEGQIGDMEMSRGNRAIHDHQRDGRELCLFQKRGSGIYEYLGAFEYVSHEFVSGKDGSNAKRQAIAFRLRRTTTP
jgi:5-methylcytosine-specific restriction protein A